MSHIHTEFKTSADLDGEENRLTIRASGFHSRELYGSDADGRRGVYMDSVDLNEIEIEDEAGRDITEQIRTTNARLFSDLRDEAELKLMEEV